MYTTEEVVNILKNSNLGLVFHMLKQPNVHIFKTIHDDICLGRYGNGAIIPFKINEEPYSTAVWIR